MGFAFWLGWWLVGVGANPIRYRTVSNALDRACAENIYRLLFGLILLIIQNDIIFLPLRTRESEEIL